MAEKMIDLIALYEEHKLILTILHGADIIESDVWHVICMFLDNSIVLENFKAIQAVEKLEAKLKMANSSAELSNQRPKSGKRSSARQQSRKKDPRSATPREPILSPEFIAHRINRCQWFEYPRSH